MPSQLQKGTTFHPGDTVTDATLNALVDAATALPGIITEPSAVTAVPTDKVLIYRSPSSLHSALVSDLQTGVTSVSATIDSGATVLQFTVSTPTTTPAFHIGLDNQVPNTFLAGRASGTTNAAPTFRAIMPQDTATFIDIPVHAIDLTAGNVFRKMLPHLSSGSFVLNLNGGLPGQRVTIYLIQNEAPGNTPVLWGSEDPGTPVIRWPGGVDHTMTVTGLGRTDIINFLCMGSGLYYGTFDKDFTP